jgi:hypothetical protein
MLYLTCPDGREGKL